MGEHPPSCSTPQGPGVPWALRPRFPRVDSSGATGAPSSRSVISHFAHLLSPRGSPPSSRSPFPFLAILTILLHGPIQLPPRISPPSFARVSLRFVPFLASGFSTSFPTPLPVPISLSLPRVSPRDSTLPRLCFPRCRFGYVFLSFLLRFLRFPSLLFPFLASSSLQFSLPSSSSVLPPSSRPHGVPTLPPFSFRIPGSTAALSRLGFCGPRVAPKRPHTTPEKRQSSQGQRR